MSVTSTPKPGGDPAAAGTAAVRDRWRLWRTARNWARAELERQIQRNVRDNEVALLVTSAVIGAGIGLAVEAIEALVQALHELAFAIAPGQHLSEGGAIEWWRLLALPALGGLLSGGAAWLIRRFRPHETIDAIEANALFGGKMSLADSVSLTFLTMISTGFGASVGME